jgi:NADH-quinone oxidoreductase subunit D
MTGPMLRGSGVAWDLRKKQPYAKYAEVDFDIPSASTGDCYDRYLVRMEEMRQSTRIIKQCVDKLRTLKGPVTLHNYKVDSTVPRGDEGRHGSADPSLQALHRRLLVPEGEIYAAVEAPKGEFGAYIMSDGANKPFRLKLRAPGFAHLSSMDEVVRGHMLSGRGGHDRHLRRRVRRD